MENNGLTKNDLGEFTDTVLLPAIENIIDTKLDGKFDSFEERIDLKFAKERHEIKDYIDRKLAVHHSEIVSVFRGEKERDKAYKLKLLSILQRNKLVDESETTVLQQLAQ
ncbi:hypothetical protein HQ571_04530 [Candidatus Kuenenbacteria bacterium]|nr:hypothetical protein [Candidatus Kuenenbacteria bacterium]